MFTITRGAVFVRWCLSKTVWILPAVALSAGPASCQDLLSSAKAAIEARARQVKTVDMTWRAKTEYLQTEDVDEDDPKDPFGGSDAANKAKHLPATFEWEARLRISGLKIRYENSRPIWLSPAKGYSQLPKVYTFDGHMLRMHRRVQERKFSDMGFIWKQPTDYRGPLDTLPELWHFRGLSYPEMLGDGFLRPEVNAARETVDGRMYLAFRRPRGRNFPGEDEVLWLDPEFDYAIRRLAGFRGAHLLRDLHVDYRRTEQGIFAPTKWSQMEYNRAGKVTTSTTATAIALTINQPIDDSVFYLKFPAGTIVRDERDMPVRDLLIGSEERQYVITRKQLSQASSAKALLEELERSP